jgi:hypothetical protein
MRWGENKNVRPKHGTDALCIRGATQLRPRLWHQPHFPGTPSLVCPGSITGAARRRYFE